ncbi:MAG: hypothetical protein WC951_00785 [Bacteroidales bacterium]
MLKLVSEASPEVQSTGIFVEAGFRGIARGAAHRNLFYVTKMMVLGTYIKMPNSVHKAYRCIMYAPD